MPKVQHDYTHTQTATDYEPDWWLSPRHADVVEHRTHRRNSRWHYVTAQVAFPSPPDTNVYLAIAYNYHRLQSEVHYAAAAPLHRLHLENFASPSCAPIRMYDGNFDCVRFANFDETQRASSGRKSKVAPLRYYWLKDFTKYSIEGATTSSYKWNNMTTSRRQRQRHCLFIQFWLFLVVLHGKCLRSWTITASLTYL